MNPTTPNPTPTDQPPQETVVNLHPSQIVSPTIITPQSQQPTQTVMPAAPVQVPTQPQPLQPQPMQPQQTQPQYQAVPQPMMQPVQATQPQLQPQAQLAQPMYQPQPYQQANMPAYMNPAPQATAPHQSEVKNVEHEAEEEIEKVLSELHHHSRGLSLVTAILVVLLSLGNVYLMYHVQHVRSTKRNNQPWVKAALLAKQAGPDVVTRSDGTLDLSHKIDTTYMAKEQNLSAKVGQQVNLNNGLSFMVAKVEKDWKDNEDSYSNPGQKEIKPAKSGYYYIKLTIIRGNRSNNTYDTGSMYTSELQFKGADGSVIKDSYSYFGDSAFTADETLLDNDYSTLESGESKKDVYILTAPVGTVPSLVYKVDFTSFEPPTGKETNSKTVKLNAEVSLQ